VEEEVGQETGVDTHMPETSEPSDSQKKRTGEKESGSRKKVKAHRTPPHTSLTTDDVELVATTIEDRLSEAWENVEKHRASIIEQVQEVKTALEQLNIRDRAATKRHTNKDYGRNASRGNNTDHSAGEQKIHDNTKYVVH
jgi:hypothetical protein